MGTHLYYYKKLNPTPDYEYARQKVLAYYRKIMADMQLFTNNTGSKRIKSYFERDSIEDIKYELALLERICRMIEKRLCKYATMECYADLCCRYIKFSRETGFLYKDTKDCTRISCYSSRKFYSEEETFNFLQGRKILSSIPDFHQEKIRKFWRKYPDGMICIG
jgi:hypothetical protein